MKTTTQTANFPLGVALGQLIAILLAFSGTFVELTGSRARPMFMVAFTYLLIVLLHGPYLYFRGQRSHTPIWRFTIVGAIDTAAAYTSVCALTMTSVTSWSLLQPANLLIVVPLSSLFLNAHYSWSHLLSGLLAIAGLALLLFSDVHDDRSHVISGDALALLGSLLYGLNQVLVEGLVKDVVSPPELLSGMCGFGVVFAGALSLILGEWWPELSYPVGIYVAATASLTCALYSVMPTVLRNAGAASLTISMLATSLWSVLGKLTVVGDFHPNVAMFVCAFAMIVGGVGMFAFSGDPYTQPYVPLEDGEGTQPPSNVELTIQSNPNDVVSIDTS